MYIRVTTLGYDPAREEEVFKILDDDVIPRLRQLPGFVSYHGGLDSDAKRGVAVTMWNDMEHAAGFRTALGGLIQQFEEAGVGFDPPQVYEVTRQVDNA